MIATWTLLNVLTSLMSCAKRVKHQTESGVVPQPMNGLMLTQASSIGLSNLPHIQMQASQPTGGDIPRWFSNATGVIVPARTWRGQLSETKIGQQLFPPATVYRMHPEKFLHIWAMASASAKYWHRETTAAIDRMLTVIAEPTSSKLPRFHNTRLTALLSGRSDIEMVALIPKDFFEERPFVSPFSSRKVTHVPNAIDADVQSLCVFSREKVKDDRMGSLRKHIQKQHRKQGILSWLRPREEEFDAFAIEGLVDAPVVAQGSASALLSKIKQYAEQEQKIVVVPKRAYIGSDLLDYYVSLGFEQVEMHGRLPELVYDGTSSSSGDDTSASMPWGLRSLQRQLRMKAEEAEDENHIMVQMNLWAGE